MSPRRPKPRHRQQPSRRSVLAGGAAAGVALLGGGGYAWHALASDDDTASARCENPQTVEVVAPDEIVNDIKRAATAVEAKHTVCARFVVSAANLGETYNAIVESPSSAPQIWVADSPIWAQLLNKKLGSGWITTGDTIATSPVVLAVPHALTSQLPKLTGRAAPTWLQTLAGEPPVGVIDPHASTASLLHIVAANQQATTNAQRSDLMKKLLQLSRSQTTSATMFAKAAGPAKDAVVFPASEKQIQDFNSAHPKTPLTPVVPSGGMMRLEYQLLTPVRGTPVPQAALQALRRELLSHQEVTRRAQHNLRDADATPLRTGRRELASAPTMPKVSEQVAVGSYTAWNNLAKDARMLALIDVSGSMAERSSSGQTKIELLAGMAIGAVDNLPRTTRLGAWAFSTDLQPGGVDYLPLTKNEPELTSQKARDELKRQVRRLPQLVAKNGDTGLYDSIAAAFKSVNSSYSADHVNSVVVMTDGANDDPNGGLSLEELLATLKKSYNPHKPVKIVTIAIGAQADPEALRKIAKATDGLSYTASKPEDVTKVFVDAFLRRDT